MLVNVLFQIRLGRDVRPSVRSQTLRPRRQIECERVAARLVAAVDVRWTPWLPTRGVALAWLALRQAVPMCLPGLVIAA